MTDAQPRWLLNNNGSAVSQNVVRQKIKIEIIKKVRQGVAPTQMRGRSWNAFSTFFMTQCQLNLHYLSLFLSLRHIHKLHGHIHNTHTYYTYTHRHIHTTCTHTYTAHTYTDTYIPDTRTYQVHVHILIMEHDRLCICNKLTQTPLRIFQHVSLTHSVTSCPEYLFEILPFTTIKIFPITK